MKIMIAIAIGAIAAATPALAQMNHGSHKGAHFMRRHYSTRGGHGYGSYGGYNSANGAYQNGNMAPGGGPGVHD